MKTQFNPSSNELLIDLSGRDLTRIAFWTFFFADVALLLLDLVVNFAKPIDAPSVRRLFNIAREDGIGTYIGSFQTLCVGYVLVHIWIHARISQLPKHLIRFWGFLSSFFIYMAFDDVAGLHERYGSILKAIFKGAETDLGIVKKTFATFPSYSWQLLLGPILIWILYLMMKNFNQEVKDKNQRDLLMKAVLCYVLAVFLDFVEGLHGFFETVAKDLSVNTYTVSHLFKASEEFLELFGTTLFLTGFTRIFLSKVSTLKLLFKDTGK